MIYASYPEFITSEYLDEGYTQYLLGEELCNFFKEEGELPWQNELRLQEDSLNI